MGQGRGVAIVALLTLAGGMVQGAFAMPPAASVEPLIETSETVLGQEFFYPEGRARITAAVVTVPPGALLPPHLHPVPLFAYVLQGELVVDYGSEGERVYRRGDALVEAFDWPHQGRNGGRGVVKILVVYAGAEGVPDSEPAELE
jgi:quercetin dioxygenase-like cupin family protein